MKAGLEVEVEVEVEPVQACLPNRVSGCGRRRVGKPVHVGDASEALEVLVCTQQQRRTSTPAWNRNSPLAVPCTGFALPAVPVPAPEPARPAGPAGAVSQPAPEAAAAPARPPLLRRVPSWVEEYVTGEQGNEEGAAQGGSSSYGDATSSGSSNQGLQNRTAAAAPGAADAGGKSASSLQQQQQQQQQQQREHRQGPPSAGPRGAGANNSVPALPAPAAAAMHLYRQQRYVRGGLV